MSEVELALSVSQAEELLPGRYLEVQVEFLRPENHTWRITADGESFFLKAHTKPWYDGRPSPLVVRRELTAHRLLREHGLPALEIVGSSLTCENPLGWPYMLSRELPGAALTDALPELTGTQADEALREVGSVLARMHALEFEHPGPLIDGPPAAPPDPDRPQHWIWRVERLLAQAFPIWAADLAVVPPRTMDAVTRLLADRMQALRATYERPRFVHGDCHASQFFLARTESGDTPGWRVTGVVDLEVASTGSPLEDFLKFTIEMAGRFGAGPVRWWEPFFEGYSDEAAMWGSTGYLGCVGSPGSRVERRSDPVDFDLMRLRLLAADQINFACHGPYSWPGDRARIVRHVATAGNWAELFDMRRLRDGTGA